MIESPPPLRIASFYPWPAFEACGAWSRFTSMWKLFIDRGASVTLCFMGQGENASLGVLSTHFTGGAGAWYAVGQISKRILANDAKSELRNFSADELNFILLFEKQLYLGNSALASHIETTVAASDLVTCEYPMMAPALSELCRKHKKPLIITAHDLLYELHGNHPVAKAKIREAEIAALKLGDAVVACNEGEAEILRSHGVTCEVVPNTGDALSIAPGGTAAGKAWVRSSLLETRLDDYVLFVGSSHGPNREAALELKKLARAFPKVCFVVAGSCLAKASEDNFRALGPVSERQLDLLYRGATAVVILMLRGTGMSLKTFQALAYGKPILTTAVGARGFPVVHDTHALVAGSPQEFAPLLKRLVGDHHLRDRLSAEARALSLTLDYRTQFAPYAAIAERLCGKTLSGTEAQRPASLVLVDNNLKDTVGHHFNYALSIAQECQMAGTPFAAIVNAAVTPEVSGAFNTVPVFKDGIHGSSLANPYPGRWSLLRDRYDILTAAARFAEELAVGLSQTARPGDRVFLPNATPPQILGLALLLETRAVFRLLRFNVLLRYSLNAVSGPITQRQSALDPLQVDRYRTSLEHLLSVNQVSEIRLTTDSAELAKEYATSLGTHFDVMPIPHAKAAPLPAWPEVVPPKQPGRIRLVFLGDARDEKGFELLPSLVRSVFANPGLNAVEFVLQTYVSSPYHALMKLSIDELAKLESPRLTLVRRSLSPTEYQALLESADLVLVPYDLHTYRARTSGPFMEALCAGKPAIIPKGSWMGTIAGDSRAVEQFTSGNATELAKAVLNAVARIADISAAAQTLGAELSAEHCPTTFTQSLLGKTNH